VIAGLSGGLLSHDALEHLARQPQPNVALDASALATSALRTCQTNIRARLGPACGPRAVFDLLAEPLARALGFGVIPLAGPSPTLDALLQAGATPAAMMVVTAWGQSHNAVWRHAVHRALAAGVRWCLCISGPSIRIIDADRPHARRYSEFDLTFALEDQDTLTIFYALLHARAFAPAQDGTLFDKVVTLCEQHRVSVRVSLREGVQSALLSLIDGFRTVSRRRSAGQLLDEALIVVYRILFLLFAEARSLVPRWHPVYRDNYTIDGLQRQLERECVPPGLWESLQAIARLAHRGCHAGTLRVPPFNGRLFSPTDAPLADSVPLDDRLVGRAVIALTTRTRGNGREAISYADLGVEQLGAVYEHLLDYDLATATRTAPAVLVPTGRRKATGSFYTPRSLTDFLVRRTLAPVVQDATPERILQLRVLDPAMGSGAFLVGACRYLASAYEHALLQEGALTANDVSEDDRAGFRRAVAQHCLYGVDVNPMAVQLGRLSLWLATLAADKPLSFLDHHLRIGNSVVGGSIEDILRQPSPGGTPTRLRELPLFEDDELQSSLLTALSARLAILRTPDDTIEQVRTKERTLAALYRPGGPLERWKTAVNIWCAAWFGRTSHRVDRATFQALVDVAIRGTGALPGHIADPLLAAANDIALTERFFHWPFEFPEVFYDELAAKQPGAGFDVVIGNPPWEMLRDEGGNRRTEQLAAFVRSSAIYRLQGQGHTNLYRLFVERTLQLLRAGGRAGLVLPSGFATDHSCAPLRRMLIDRTSVDTFTTLENRDGVFPIHRSLKFLLITFTNSGNTSELPWRPAVRSPDALDRVPDLGAGPDTIVLPRSLIAQISGESLAIPDIRTPLDIEIASAIAFRVPASSDPGGWGIRFGRELNATDDRPHFNPETGLRVVEGKQLAPFHVDTRTSLHRIRVSVASTLLDPDKTFRHARLGYRDVASATNKTTLIAAIVPANVVTTHTVFCLKNRLDEMSQLFLCGIFNSYVANYLVRMRVGTHVTTSIVASLPVPKPPATDPAFQRVARLSRALSRRFTLTAFARLNALVADLYGLSHAQFAHVLETFPLVPASERAAAVGMFAPSKV
jgi:Eco57I restriction-modification methylase